jgi:hypothetical protein
MKCGLDYITYQLDTGRRTYSTILIPFEVTGAPRMILSHNCVINVDAIFLLIRYIIEKVYYVIKSSISITVTSLFFPTEGLW